ncbi:hypothetical protein [Luteolibacter sp. LG18]|uniref:hypothetical protein n=1 Tax=Luteolibacter sp. LG18 TaxID=2819286 RepID=UPI002B31EFF5|nr:hypothetical protein llg_03050 [Luteolibacter sp. LG18]
MKAPLLHARLLMFAAGTLAPLPALHAAPEVAASTAPADAGLAAAIQTGDFKAWRKTLAARITAAAAKPTLTPAEAKAQELDLARHEFLLQTMASTGLPPATRPGQPDKTTAGDALAAVAQDPGGKAFLTWLLNDPAALGYYLDSTFFAFAETDRTYGLQVWRKIWEKDPESHSGLWCRVGAAFAVAYGKERIVTETAWDQKIERTLDPLERYDFYRASFQQGKLMPYFAAAPAWELVYTVHASYRSIEEMKWAQQMLPPERFNPRGAGNMEYQIVKYRLYNYRDSIIHGTAYFDGKPNTLMTIADYGSVCGGLSNTGISVANVFGLPAFTIGQPGHCAFVLKGSPSSWDGGNFVSGWKDSFDAHQIKFFACAYSVNVKLLSRAWNHPQFAEAERLRRLGNVKLGAGDNSAALANFDKASKLCPFHFLARAAMIRLLMEDDKPAFIARLRQECVDLARELAEFPMATETLRKEAETKRLNPSFTPDQKAAYLGQIAAGLSSATPTRQANLGTKAFADALSRQLATFGLKDKEVDKVIDLAVFPKKLKAGETAPAPPVLKAPAKTEELVRYLNALESAANAREAFAASVNAVVAALPENVRQSVHLKTAPKPDPKPATYDAKTFVKVGSWTRDSIGHAPVVTDGWHEMEIALPPAERRPGQLTVAFVQTNGETLNVENLRLFADGTEVDADDRALVLKGKKPGLFSMELEPAMLKAKLTLKAVVSDVPDGKTSDGEVRILEPAPQTAQR